MLFGNECLRVLLTGLPGGEAVAGCTAGTALLIVVTFGQLRLDTADEQFVAHAGQTLALRPCLPFRLSTDYGADFLLIGSGRASPCCCPTAPARAKFPLLSEAVRLN